MLKIQNIILVLSVLIITLLSPILVCKPIDEPRIVAILVALLIAPLIKTTLYLMLLVLILFGSYGVIGLSYGNPGAMMTFSFIETNLSEVVGFGINIPARNWIISGLFLMVSVLYFLTAKRFTQKRSFSINILIFLAFLVFLSVSYEGRYFNAVKNGVHEYIEHNRLMKQSMTKEDTWSISQNKYHSKYENYLLIIGESVRKDYMGVYGYSHNTTPYLKNKSGIYFENAFSVAASTTASLTRTLQQTNGFGGDIQPENNIITLANKAGYKTIWLSSTSLVGKNESAISVMANKAHDSDYLTRSFFDTKTRDDFELLASLSKKIKIPSDKPRLFIMQTCGSHQPVCRGLNNYPVDFNISSNSEVNCYLASIHKLDTLIKRAVEILKSDGSYSIIYFSDHGLSIKHNSVMHKFDIYNNYQVPLIVLNSDANHQTFHDKDFSLINFMPLFSQWLGIKTVGLESKYDIYKPLHIPAEHNVIVFSRTGSKLELNKLKKEDIID